MSEDISLITQNRINNLEETFSNIDTNIDTLNVNVSNVNTNLNNQVTIINNSLTDINTTITNNQNDLIAIINDLKSRIQTLESHKHIIQTWSSGTSWYRVWSDGWIEQGGKLTPASGGQDVTLHKNYTTTNYGVQATNCDSANHRGAQAWVVNMSTIRVRATGGTSASSTPCCWYAYGY